MTRLSASLLAFTLLVFAPRKAAADPADLERAHAAVAHLLDHFWTGTAADGHIVPTWGGYQRKKLPDPRGGLWERATLYFTLNDFYLVTRDPDLESRLRAEWRHVSSIYPAAKLQAVGESSGTNWACDDAGWSSMFYWTAWQRTGDPAALADAKAIVRNAYARWLDAQLGGGMWYADADHHIGGKLVPREKSLYQAGIVLTSLRLYEATHDRSFLDPALDCYNWMEAHLRRPDGIYWCGYGANGPQGANRPGAIHEAGSVSFLAGNMAMGVIQATLYRITGDDHYRRRAVQTAAAIRASREVDADGVLVDDRDAWVDGTFAGDWAREVLTLPGIAEADRELLRRTALAAATKDCTVDGYYGGCWDGPADGWDSVWSRGGSSPYQIMTSANAANMIVAAAALP